MIVIESDCCDCGLYCIHEKCKYHRVARFYCDDCNDEANLWYFDGQELCVDCILKRLEEVSYED